MSAVERNAALLTRLIADLVDVSRIVSGTLTLNIQPTDVRTIIDVVLESLRPAIQSKKLCMEVVSPVDLDPIAVDPDRFQQIVWNLLANAVKFTPAQGTIAISARQRSTMIEIAIADTGPGIRAEFLPRVFDRFSQQDAGLTREHGGLGLGLAIVRHLTEMHGGAVTVDSTEGQGATFTIAVPVADTVTTSRTPVLPAPHPAQLRQLHILVIDDDADAREFVAAMLTDSGARVTVAASAAEGHDRLTHDRFDLLLCDIGMPG